MKNRALKLTTVALAFTMLAACGEKPLTDTALQATEIARFNTIEGAAAFFESDGWTNESVFNCRWNKKNVTYTESGAKLSIAQNPNGSGETNDAYFGGEIRSYQYFGFGDYKVSMKPSSEKGTASTFFTCTGSYDTDEDGNPNPHDEIDIEFLGKDTTKVQFNYFVNGQGGHEHMYDLGFDASKEFHTYGYRWSENSICWFVDDKPVYKVTESEKNPLPKTPGRILMNYWCGTTEAEGWMGKYAGNGEKTSDYAAVYTSATPIGEIPEPAKEEDLGNGEIVDITSLEYTTEGYTITADETTKSLNVAYADFTGGNYNNVIFPVAEHAVGKTAVRLTAKNNGTADATIRLDLQATKKVGNTDACNVSASATGDIAVSTDLEWGGSTLTLPAGEETAITIKYTSNSSKGHVKNILAYFDSSKYQDTATYSNNITLSGLAFYGNEVVEEAPADSAPIESSQTDSKPEEPVPGGSEGPAADGYVTMDLSGVDGWGNYTVDTTDGVTISHSSALGQWSCCGYGGVDLTGVTKMKFNVQNLDPTNDSNFKLTIKHDGDADPCDAITKMKINDGEWQDENSGGYGASVDIPVGATMTLEFQIDATKDADTMVFSIDSQNPTNVETGSIKISGAMYNKAA